MVLVSWQFLAGYFGAFLGRVGYFFGRPWVIVGRPGPFFGCIGAILGNLGGHRRPSWTVLKVSAVTLEATGMPWALLAASWLVLTLKVQSGVL